LSRLALSPNGPKRDSADSKHGDREAHIHRRLHRNREGLNHRRDVRNNNDAFGKIKFKIPPFNGKYDPDAYITWEIAIDQKLNFLRIKEFGQQLVSSLIFASVWWVELGKKNPYNIPQTWDALK
jgi:hypothetical protein